MSQEIYLIDEGNELKSKLIDLFKKEKEYKDIYKKWKKVVRTKAGFAFKVDIIPREKIRAIIMMIWPRLMPWMKNKRNKKWLFRGNGGF